MGHTSASSGWGVVRHSGSCGSSESIAYGATPSTSLPLSSRKGSTGDGEDAALPPPPLTSVSGSVASESLSDGGGGVGGGGGGGGGPGLRFFFLVTNLGTFHSLNVRFVRSPVVPDVQ